MEHEACLPTAQLTQLSVILLVCEGGHQQRRGLRVLQPSICPLLVRVHGRDQLQLQQPRIIRRVPKVVQVPIQARDLHVAQQPRPEAVLCVQVAAACSARQRG